MKCEHHPSDASDEARRAPSYDGQHDTQNSSGDIEAVKEICKGESKVHQLTIVIGGSSVASQGGRHH